MKKLKIAIVLLCTILICFGGAKEAKAEKSIPAERQLPRLTDEADLLTKSEEAKLIKKLDQLSERYQYDIVIHTVEYADYDTMEQYTDDFYDYNGFGFGTEGTGVILAIDIGNRDWHISTAGEAIDAFSDRDIGKIGDAVVPFLSDGQYFRGFDKFIEVTKEVITAYQEGRKPQIRKDDDTPKAKHSYEAATDDSNKVGGGAFWKRTLIALGLSLAIAFATVAVLTRQLNTIRAVSHATQYEVPGSFKLNLANEFFLYKTVSRTKRSSSSSGGSSSHSGSSGRSHGGGGGKF